MMGTLERPKNKELSEKLKKRLKRKKSRRKKSRRKKSA